MVKLKDRVTLETAFGTYVVDELIGEGGAGKVYGGVGSDSSPVAIKVLASDRASSDKRKRFKNEIAFLARNKHANIVSVLDHGIADDKKIVGPFYVMRRYDGNLRTLMQKWIPSTDILGLFGQILDGVEAAHLQALSTVTLRPRTFCTIAWHAFSQLQISESPALLTI